MPSIKDESTVKAIAREFTSNGRDKAQAMRTIGYAESSCKSGKAVKDVYGNLRVVAAIKAIDDKDIAEMDLSRQAQYKRLLLAYDMAVDQKRPQAIKSVLAELNLMLGYQRESAPNKEKEQARAARMTEEDKKLALALAKVRTQEEARRGLKLA